MLLLKKLCRVNGTNYSNSRSNLSGTNDQHLNTVAQNVNDTASIQVANFAAASSNEGTLPGVVGSHNSRVQSQRNFEAAEDSQFVREVFCRTPPPVYDHNCGIPATPPPSYTRRTNNRVEANRNNNNSNIYNNTSNALIETPSHDAQNESAAAIFAGTRALADDNATRIASFCQTHQQPQQFEAQLNNNQRRLQRQRLHRLQQQQQRRIDINATSTDSSTSSNSDLEIQHNSNRSRAISRAQRFEPEERPSIFRDAYCPDLLHACSLILRERVGEESLPTSDSSVASFTDTATSSIVEYAEIEDIRTGEFQRNQQQSSLYRRARSTPNLENGLTNNEATNNFYIAKKTIPDQRQTKQDMGQNLSLRRPRFSLTWVLREQQQQQKQQQNSQGDTDEQAVTEESQQTQQAEHFKNNILNQDKNGIVTLDAVHNNNNGCAATTTTSITTTKIISAPNCNGEAAQNETKVKPINKKLETINLTQVQYAAPKKRYRLKQLPGATEPLNGYATTPTGNLPSAVSSIRTSQTYLSNQHLSSHHKDKESNIPSKELFFVCTPQRVPKCYNSVNSAEAMAVAKKRNELHRRFAAKMTLTQQSSSVNRSAADGAADVTSTLNTTRSNHVNSQRTVLINGSFEKDELKSLKCPSYSEPSLIAASEGNPRRHRHRKRRDRIRGTQKFGYEISNVDEFLSKCSLTAPANIPVVLSLTTTLYQTRPDGYQAETTLPLGMVVNAVFKNQNWLYVQTPHAEEGYVGYTCCLPLGILPPPSTQSMKTTPCWESNVDIFPRPCGNMTDSEKEIRLRGGTRSDGTRTPCGKRVDAATVATTTECNEKDSDTVNGNCVATKSLANSQAHYCEQQVDSLYLRVASQPKLVEKAYAQLRSIKNAAAAVRTRTTTTTTTTDEYVTLKSQQKVQQAPSSQIQQQFYEKPIYQLNNRRPLYVTNGQNGQHLHPSASSLQINTANTTNTSTIQHVRKQQHNQEHSLRETLVAINMDFITDCIKLYKGEIVTLCECRESKDQRQWFYVKARDGREGYIPAEVAGHGYL